jgi:hypothetical protein
VTGWQLDQLVHVLNTLSGQAGYRVLTCAPDVRDLLRDTTVPARPEPGFPTPGLELALLTGIQIVTDPGYERGAFRLVRHAACSVDPFTERVTHPLCPVVIEGVLRQ